MPLPMAASVHPDFPQLYSAPNLPHWRRLYRIFNLPPIFAVPPPALVQRGSDTVIAMTSLNMTFRFLTPADREIMRVATLANMNWTGESRFTYADIDSSPEFRHYYRLDGHSGDFGIAAEIEGRIVGISWLTFFDAEDPGYGYIADGIPELSVSVWKGYRRRGVGKALLEKLFEKAKNRSITRICLSVEEGNGAVELYKKLGFVRVDGNPYNAYLLDFEPPTISFNDGFEVG